MQNLNTTHEIPAPCSGHTNPGVTLDFYMTHMAQTFPFIQAARYVPPRMDSGNVVKMVSP